MSMLTPRLVKPDAWLAEAQVLAGSWFCYLDATDEIGRSDEITVTLRVIPVGGEPVALATRVPRNGGSLPSLSSVWLAAGWSERSITEGFGVAFDGLDDIRPVHVRPESGLPEHPLLKDRLLPQRQVTPWPGAKGDDSRARRRQTAVGVADESAQSAEERVASAFGGRRR